MILHILAGRFYLVNLVNREDSFDDLCVRLVYPKCVAHQMFWNSNARDPHNI